MKQCVLAAAFSGVVVSATAASAQSVELMLEWDAISGANGALEVGETVTVDVMAMFSGGGSVLAGANFTMAHANASVTDAVVTELSLDLGSVVADGTAVVASSLGQSNIFGTYDLAPIHLFSYTLTADGSGSVAVTISSAIFNTLSGFSPVDHDLLTSSFEIEVNPVPTPGFVAVSAIAGLSATRRRRA